MQNFLTSAQVARRLGVSVSTVARWASDGRLPAAMQLPGRKGARLFDHAAVELLADELAAEAEARAAELKAAAS